MGHPSFVAGAEARGGSVRLKRPMRPKPLAKIISPSGFSETAALVNHVCQKRARNERKARELFVCLSQRRLRVQFGFAVYLDTFLDEKVEALRENLFLSG